MASTLATPGVYIEEKSSFGSSVVPVQTALPAFVGYTEKSNRGSKSLINKPTKISSFGQFVELFGGAPKTKFNIEVDDSSAVGFKLSFVEGTRFLLYDSIRLFYANGGADCFIVSVGGYNDKIDASKLNDPSGGGLLTLEKDLEPTILVIPEAVLLSESDCYSLQAAMLSHCGYKMKNRFAVLDVYDGFKERTLDEDDVVNKFREGVGSNFLQWGAAYYPWLNTAIVKSSELDYSLVANPEELVAILTAEVDENLAAENISEARSEGIKAEINKILDTTDKDLMKTLQSTLMVVSPKILSVMEDMGEMMNLLPPSAAMAGAYTMVDSSVSVAKSPANISLGSVISPAA
jgi:phage tail sheath protein FI